MVGLESHSVTSSTSGRLTVASNPMSLMTLCITAGIICTQVTHNTFPYPVVSVIQIPEGGWWWGRKYDISLLGL